MLQPRSPREPEFLEQLAALAVDCAPVVAYGALVPQAALDLPRHGWVNLHFSLLPAWRGAAPVQHAIMAGDEITGASTFLLEAGPGHRPVFGTVTEAIGPRDTAGDLLGRLAGQRRRACWSPPSTGSRPAPLVAEPQPAEGISLAPRIETADAQVDWTLPAHVVDRRVRGRHPGTRRLDDVARRPAAARPGAAGARRRPGWPPASSRWEPTASSSAPAGAPSGSGDVQPAGKRMLPAADWARGARPPPGERVGG